MIGYIYIMRNPSIIPKGLLKIGLTKNIEERRKSLSNTSVPDEYEILNCLPVNNMSKAEGMVFSRLNKYRYKKEFFLCSVTLAKEISLEVANEINKNINSESFIDDLNSDWGLTNIEDDIDLN